jgi:putative transposase
MIQIQLKLKLSRAQEALLDQWLWHLTAVWNWAIRKLEQDAKDGIYYSPQDFQNLLADHCKKLGIPSHVIQGILSSAHLAWKRCFKKLAKKPRLKGKRNKLNSMPFPDPFRAPKEGRITIPGLKSVRFHKQAIPEGTIKCGRIVKRASGWYLGLFIDAKPEAIPHKDNLRVGIDPGFKHVITLSTGEKKEHPGELEQSEARLAQAQRGRDKRLATRLHERISNQRKDRNHKLSRELVERCSEIYFSDDNYKAIARSFGKSVASSSHAGLRRMLDYKCRTGGRRYVEVPSRHSTRTCSACGCLSGPTGYAGLSVRQWVCSECGAEHDRDINAAINTLIVGVGRTHEGGSCHAA